MYYLKRYFVGQLAKTVRHFGRIAESATPELTTANMKRSLQECQIKYQEGHTCWTVECPTCVAQPKDTKIYINKTTGWNTVMGNFRHAFIWKYFRFFYVSV